jgi:tripartite-type tricarboxylate transporter receptor subunit TctC
MICGYPGSAEYVLAMLKGEVDLVSSAWNNWRATNMTEIKAGDLVPVIQGGLKRNRELADVPLMQELVTDPDAKKVIEFVVGGAAIGRALLLPPGVPADRIAYLRAAFDRMVKDPELIAAAEKRGLELDPAAGADVQKISDAIVATPKAMIDAATKAMQ